MKEGRKKKKDKKKITIERWKERKKGKLDRYKELTN